METKPAWSASFRRLLLKSLYSARRLVSFPCESPFIECVVSLETTKNRERRYLCAEGIRIWDSTNLTAVHEPQESGRYERHESDMTEVS